ncbi:MAG: hypothetical protein EOP45_07055 [Sphingobacteriaceae bacterium]|nr:MAG: hypothetical protein EOP45_07055 [Sphingobacteriaceae bacterium]
MSGYFSFKVASPARFIYNLPDTNSLPVFYSLSMRDVFGCLWEQFPSNNFFIPTSNLNDFNSSISGDIANNE